MLRRLYREGSRLRPTVKVSMLVAALSTAVALAAAQETGSGPLLEGLKRLDLPQEIALASDVRWLADGEIILGVIGPGIHAWRLGASGAEFRVALEEPEPEVLEIGGRSFVARSPERDYGRLAVSRQRIAFADLFGGIHFAHEDGISGPVDMEFLGDLDRKGPRTAAVGLMRNDADGWAPFVAWLIADGGGSPRGLLPTRDGGRGLELCRDAELSVIRFISEDRLLAIPGAEAGVFVYDLDGALHDSLDAATFFAESGCDVEAEEWDKSPLSDAYVRADWLGPRRIIDEVVADGKGNVYFFVRYGADRPVEEPVAAIGSLPDLGRRAVASGIPRRRFGHHVALRSSPEAARPSRARAGSTSPRRVRPQQPDATPSRAVTRVNAQAGAVSGSVVASVPPPSGRVCWDLVHARAEDLRASSMQPCVVESEFADTRLRADLRGDRAVILLRGGALRGGDVREAEAFEARIRPPAGSGD